MQSMWVLWATTVEKLLSRLFTQSSTPRISNLLPAPCTLIEGISLPTSSANHKLYIHLLGDFLDVCKTQRLIFEPGTLIFTMYPSEFRLILRSLASWCPFHWLRRKVRQLSTSGSRADEASVNMARADSWGTKAEETPSLGRYKWLRTKSSGVAWDNLGYRELRIHKQNHLPYILPSPHFIPVPHPPTSHFKTPNASTLKQWLISRQCCPPRYEHEASCEKVSWAQKTEYCHQTVGKMQ